LFCWPHSPANNARDGRHFRAVLLTLDRQRGVAGQRMAWLLNHAYASCPTN